MTRYERRVYSYLTFWRIYPKLIYRRIDCSERLIRLKYLGYIINNSYSQYQPTYGLQLLVDKL